ncbi:DUF3575 domain-containing protein [Chryseobacterium fistulae]|uniref:DUF3575 domain-containing protein n=1 Tax=Chryseobacterium fistulae TaxID=2675058 RepID=A0A6N4XS14_9FLAO|nr:DUF3575 domain-containing protein [Chryseobacterium fistulae]CAA7386200.1 hypothetical protein CHRY9393_00491 [Chryseobacterium fistulae]
MKLLLKKLYILSSIGFISLFSAQTDIKIDPILVPIGVFNMAIEKPISKKITLQGEVFISPWKSFAGKKLEVYMGTLEGRYYFTEAMKKWYVGGYFSMATFDLQKWNYWNKTTVQDEFGNAEILPDGTVRMTERYQKGFAFIAGVDTGYRFEINEKLGLELFVGIGTVQSFYKGYYKDTGERNDGAKKWNKSGEFLPTRGGLMLTYHLN